MVAEVFRNKANWLNRYKCLLFILFTYSCHWSEKNEKSVLLDMDWSNSSWIGAEMDTILSDSLRYQNEMGPIFRRDLEVASHLVSARLYISSAGYYHATINGEKIGKNYLDPAWSDFSKRIYYSDYDISKNLKVGKNCIGVALGNGFYNSLPMKMWGHLNLRDVLPTGEPVFIAKVILKYRNGLVEEIVTDSSWKYYNGPTVRNNVYLGEVYDARREVKGWDTGYFNDNQWNNAKISQGPGGKLQKTFFPSIQITRTISPISINPSSNNKFVIDMGENFTGTYRINLRGKVNDTITLRFGERIYDNGELNPMTTVAGQIKEKGKGGPGAPSIAWQSDSYIFGSDSDVWFSPKFTFHTYRYIELSGLTYCPIKQEVQGLAFNTNVIENGTFSCSSELINSIQVASTRTFLSNLIGVQSDCPAREKFGYGGDINATSEAFIYNFDMKDFYKKTVYDWKDAIRDSVFIDTAPYVGLEYCGLSWESAFLITQYNLYLYYNDTSLVEEMYCTDLDWMDKVSRLNPNGVVTSGLADHEAIVSSSVELIGTSHYLKCARIMKEFAEHMRDVANVIHFGKLVDKLEKILLNQFWKNKPETNINRQTVYATLLYYDVIPENEIENASKLLLESLSTRFSGHFTTGIFGTKYILEALSKSGNVNRVYEIVNSKIYPGWGYMIDQGATTLWETWKESDDTYSNCHPMFGSVSEWFYRWLGGIRPDKNSPGFEHFIINPSIPDGLDYVNTCYMSPYGKIISNWKKLNNGQIKYDLEIPIGSSANLILRNDKAQTYRIVKNRDHDYSSRFINGASGVDLRLTEGRYIIIQSSVPDN